MNIQETEYYIIYLEDNHILLWYHLSDSQRTCKDHFQGLGAGASLCILKVEIEMRLDNSGHLLGVVVTVVVVVVVAVVVDVVVVVTGPLHSKKEDPYNLKKCWGHFRFLSVMFLSGIMNDPSKLF